VEISIEEAKQLREQGRFDEAIAMLKQVIYFNIDDANTYLELGLVYFDKQDYAQAKKVLRVGMGLDPGNAQIYYTVGLVCHAMGDRDGVLSMKMWLAMVNPDLREKLANETAEKKP
jgi:tetratricopeptide (TPR) repeat protein